MFVTKRWFCDLFLSVSSLFKISKIGLWKLFCKKKFLCKVEKGIALTSDYKTEKGTLFLSILPPLKNDWQGC